MPAVDISAVAAMLGLLAVLRAALNLVKRFLSGFQDDLALAADLPAARRRATPPSTTC